MTLEEARAWLQSSAGQRYLESVDNDADAAVQMATRLVPRLSDYPASTVSDLRRQITTLERAMDAFNAACNTLIQGRARDGRAVLAAYRAYILALVRLETENTRLNAFVEQDVAALGEALLAALATWVEARVAREREQARRQLELWERRLEDARSDVTEAEIQRAINLVLAAISLVLSCYNVPRRVQMAIGAGSLTLTLLLDTALGPGSPDALGGSNAALGSLGGLPREVSTATSRWATGITAIVGLSIDTAEVDEAHRIVARTARELGRARRDYTRMLGAMSSESIQIGLAREMWRRGVERSRAAARTVRTSEADHRALTRALEEIE